MAAQQSLPVTSPVPRLNGHLRDAPVRRVWANILTLVLQSDPSEVVLNIEFGIESGHSSV